LIITIPEDRIYIEYRTREGESWSDWEFKDYLNCTNVSGSHTWTWNNLSPSVEQFQVRFRIKTPLWPPPMIVRPIDFTDISLSS
ncbi:MAG: hypothetical protein J7L61_04655, partial [Thermoplasmata archaeon]|nr:hypothetical protein [Thermoplasmata archaeon]